MTVMVLPRCVRMIDQAKAMNIPFGVYSSPSQWNPIMGGSGFAAGYPLWW
jgi:hypothetical protein